MPSTSSPTASMRASRTYSRIGRFAAGNIGCMTHLASATATPVVHTAELLDWATGGPTPPEMR